MVTKSARLPVLLSVRVSIDFGSTDVPRKDGENRLRREFLEHWVSRLSLMTQERGAELLAMSEGLFQASMSDGASAISAACALVEATLPGMVGSDVIKPVVSIVLHHGEAVGSAEYGPEEALASATRMTALAAAQQILVTHAVYVTTEGEPRRWMRPQAVAGAKEESSVTSQRYEVVWQNAVSMPAAKEDLSAQGTQRVTSVRIKQGSADTGRKKTGTRSTDTQAMTAGNEVTADRQPQQRMRLTLGGVVQLVDHIVPSISIGRSKSNGLVADASEVSRRHATVTKGNQAFTLTDHSKNGTYVYAEDGQEAYVKDSTCVLPAAGRLSLALQISKHNAPVLHFRTETVAVEP